MLKDQPHSYMRHRSCLRCMVDNRDPLLAQQSPCESLTMFAGARLQPGAVRSATGCIRASRSRVMWLGNLYASRTKSGRHYNTLSVANPYSMGEARSWSYTFEARDFRKDGEFRRVPAFAILEEKRWTCYKK